jgi:Putative adhesin
MMSLSNTSVNKRLPSMAILAMLSCLALFPLAAAAEPMARFERTYSPRGTAHLTISNVNGTIRISAWDKRTILVRANLAPAVDMDEREAGDNILIAVKRSFRVGRADFEINVPADTSLTLKNLMGDIDVQNVNGPISINSIDSNVRLIGLNSPSVDVKVTSGDILFDGDLHDSGSYSMMAVKGDLDVTVPESTPFNLNARTLSGTINLGSFIANLVSSAREPKNVSGSYLKGGPQLSLTAYAGRILLHKK